MRRRLTWLLFALSFALPVHALTDLEIVEVAKKAATGNAEAKQELESLAQGGEVLAEHFMGVLYIGGKGLPQSDSQARYAEMLSAGAGGRQDSDEARAWIEKAAAQNEPRIVPNRPNIPDATAK